MPDLKKTKAPNTTITYDRRKVKAPTQNIYKAIKIIGKRAEQVNLELKEELIKKLKEFETDQDSLAEIFENKEQIDISRFYERLPKPTAIALQEWLEGKIYWKEVSDEDIESFQ
jgi:DNA-directed RNA polymerase subunit K/omega